MIHWSAIIAVDYRIHFPKQIPFTRAFDRQVKITLVEL